MINYALLYPALLAGMSIMRQLDAANHARFKEDLSPVTAADIAAHNAVSLWLKQTAPQEPLVSEEGDLSICGHLGYWWLLDPLDGTKEFVAGSKEFAVSLARLNGPFVEQGVILAPLLGEVSWTDGVSGAWKASFDPQHLLEITEGDYTIEQFKEWCSCNLFKITSIRVSKKYMENQKKDLRVLASIRHPDAESQQLIKSLEGATLLNVGACLKFVRLAEGLADYYPRCTRLHEWDIAGGHAIVKAAGGNMYQMGTKTELRYGNPDYIADSFEGY